MDLKALVFNCTLKKSPEFSNTDALIQLAVDEFSSLGVTCEVLRPVDSEIAPGTESDMGKGDEWPILLEKLKECDIFLLASPIWIGRLSSVGQRVLERINAVFHEESLWDERGRYYSYGKVAGCLCTGNEDGAHEVSAHVLWALSELGFTIPPNVNSYWVGPAGPGPDYIEAGGKHHEFTNKTLLYTVHNLVFMAQVLRENPILTDLKSLQERAKLMSAPSLSGSRKS